MTIEEWQQLTAELTAYYAEYAELVAAGQAAPIKSGTPLMHYLVMNRPAGAALPTGLFDRHDSLSYTYGTDHFLLHYTDNGAYAVYHFNEQTIEPGTPDYIVRAGQILEYTYQHQTGDTLMGDLGFDPPLSDGYYSGGGDGRLDAYFVNMSYYGATVVDSMQVTLPLTATTYILLENDYSGFPGYEGDLNILALRVTGAHEFSHSVQFAIDITETEGSGNSMSAAWIEMSAVFMEEEHYASVNDYYNYLLYYYAVPQWSLRTGYQNPVNTLQNWQNLHMYGSVVWPLFLREHFGAKIVRNIWEICGEVPGPNWWQATDEAIRAASDESLNMREMYRRFTLWNLFTGTWARTGSYFPEAINYPRITYAAQVNSYPAVVSVPDSVLPDNLGANYILLSNLSSVPSSLVLVFEPDSTQPWGLTVVGLPMDVSDTGQPVFVDTTVYDSSTRSIFISNASEFDKIVLIPCVIGGDAIKVDYTLSIASEGVFQPNGGDTIYVGTAYQVTWFFPDSVTNVKIELSLNNGQTWSEIATTENDFVYEWTVPDSPSDSCLIRISDADNVSQYDVSDYVFSILGEGIIWPNGGEDLYAGEIYQIDWYFHDSILTIMIELSLDNGLTWLTVTTANNNGSYEWTVPDNPSDSCLIRISDADNASQYDLSDSVFSILSVGEDRIREPYPNPAWVQNVEFITFKAEQATGSAGENDVMTVTIFNIAGEKVKDFDPQSVEGGAVIVEWDFTNEEGRLVAAGAYLAIIEFAGKTEVKKFVVLR
jgi:hypothetical protein